jgi:hypothetical protein
VLARTLLFVRRHYIAFLALFVALSGSAYAAKVTLPKNSVGSSRSRTNQSNQVTLPPPHEESRT